MTFQFQCPQGHLLEGEPAQAGQQCNCPVCGMLFIIPQPPPGFAPTAAGPAPGGGAFSFDQTPAAPAPPTLGGSTVLPNTGPATPGPSFPNVAEPGAAAGSEPAAAVNQEPEFVHIPCPNGHELETPLDMIGQEVLCPECSAQFKLRRKDSVEYKRQKAIEEERRDRKVGNWWFNFAIITAVLVVIGLLAMFIASMY